ncbi:HD family phosphohydrolase [Hazenella coriacea]|uniref:HD/PDEase domain-containing protein n=1 Tax=Hazenella coriacea TaxID=1179467 RepID=A0A4R3L561_9BACL|nr:HDIG domain-containing metalloprotein [Hazenella coriacea]TCS94759.1 hypothetical protein EDD58_103178 [Hazenella coriacea]
MLKDKIEPSSPWLKRWLVKEDWKSSIHIQFFLYAIFGIAFYLLLINHILPEQYDIQVGTVSKNTIISPITKADDIATQEAKDQAAKMVELQYTKDDTITSKQIDRIDNLFAEIRKVITDPNLSEKDQKIRVNELFAENYTNQTFSDAFLKNLVNVSPKQLTEIRLQTREIVTDILNTGVRKSNLEEKREQVDRTLLNRLLDNENDPKVRNNVREISKKSIIVNEIYDEEKTKHLQDAAREAVKTIPINKGQIIVSVGELVTKDQYRKLEQLGLLKKESNMQVYFGLAIFVFQLIAMLYYYIKRFQVKLYKNNMNMILLFSVLLLTLVSMKMVAIGQNLEWSTIGYLAPIGLGAMLITLLLNIQLSLVCVVLLSISTSILFNADQHLLFDFQYGLVALVSGVASAFGLSGAKKRSSILLGGLIASVASTLAIISMYLILPIEGTWRDLVMSISFGIGSGILSAVLTIGFLPYIETVFGLLSPLRLLELSNPNHPLLRKLLIETPGTYHHSIIVGNLSEAAAESIGADGLLARVGAYYHDLGKTKRPQFFIENQIHRDNPHDKISPNLSKTIIISHPRDGVELLKQYRIPVPLQDIAAQHHGTTLLKYFYYKALNQQKDGERIEEEDYRYPGPKAQFKEAAIVGICDCVEAAVRSLSRPTPSRIQNMVKKIIQDRLEDGQFDECDLTLKELDLIAQSICETLQGIFHNRIEYPDEPAAKRS